MYIITWNSYLVPVQNYWFILLRVLSFTKLFTISVLKWFILCFNMGFPVWRITKWEYPMANIFPHISSGIVNKYLIPSPIRCFKPCKTEHRNFPYICMHFYGWLCSNTKLQFLFIDSISYMTSSYEILAFTILNTTKRTNVNLISFSISN